MKVDKGTPLAQLTCSVCHRPAAAGESVLVAYRNGEPKIMHAHVCFPPPRPSGQIIRSG